MVFHEPCLLFFASDKPSHKISPLGFLRRIITMKTNDHFIKKLVVSWKGKRLAHSPGVVWKVKMSFHSSLKCRKNATYGWSMFAYILIYTIGTAVSTGCLWKWIEIKTSRKCVNIVTYGWWRSCSMSRMRIAIIFSCNQEHRWCRFRYIVPYGLFPAIKNTIIKSVRVADSIILNSDSWILNSGTALWVVGKAHFRFRCLNNPTSATQKSP